MPGTDLSAETRLQLAPGVRTRLDAAGHVLVDAPDGTIIDLGPKGFATLSMFARPLSLGAAIERLGAKQDGILRNHQVAPNGTLRDTVVYSITASEWPAVNVAVVSTRSPSTVRFPPATATPPFGGVHCVDVHPAGIVVPPNSAPTAGVSVTSPSTVWAI